MALVMSGERSSGVAVRRPKRRSPEFHLTKAVALFLRYAWPADLPWSHFPAGEERDERTGAKLKIMGLQPGWPDFVIVLPSGRLGGLELKSEGGRQSSDQKAFQQALTAAGGRYAVCRSLADVEETADEWLARTGYQLRARCSA